MCVGHMAWAPEDSEGRCKAGLKGTKPARSAVSQKSGIFIIVNNDF